MTLKYLAPSIKTQSRSSLAPDIKYDRERERRSPWRKWYKTSRWKRLREEVLLDCLYTCTRCGKLERNTSLLVADHKVPHRGREELFWDRANLTCLCKPCHDGAKQREEREAPPGVWD
ncbi:HNH endonuclease signature motif containing protein [Agrobacterium salinitolerans]|uniref:HNH endonuclease n=1 Tax=Agrobacterium salinitolerans TaxID=1183413 RepID=UPI0022B822F1|nr:HNH endonuclease signature motif containing protein [Agrobacterium salinitolerans]MCZ7855036.1 HNH endonuclease signature motif containing protein [Agrobacterium salinitolerans]